MQGMFALCAFTFYRENSAWFKKLKWTTGDTPEYGRLFEQTSWITIHTKKCHAIIQCVYAFSVIYRSSISLRLTITDIYVIHVITECIKIYRNRKMCFYVWSEIYWLPMHNMVSWVITSSWYTKVKRSPEGKSIICVDQHSIVIYRQHQQRLKSVDIILSEPHHYDN